MPPKLRNKKKEQRERRKANKEVEKAENEKQEREWAETLIMNHAEMTLESQDIVFTHNDFKLMEKYAQNKTLPEMVRLECGGPDSSEAVLKKRAHAILSSKAKSIELARLYITMQSWTSWHKMLKRHNKKVVEKVFSSWLKITMLNMAARCNYISFEA